MTRLVHVIATTVEGTRAAVAIADPLARGAGARLVVLVPRIAAEDGDIDAPPDPTARFVQRYTEMVQSLGASAAVESFACDTIDALVDRLCDAHACIVIGGPVGRWLTSPEERFANRLARLGCQVIFAPAGANTTQRRVAA